MLSGDVSEARGELRRTGGAVMRSLRGELAGHRRSTWVAFLVVGWGLVCGVLGGPSARAQDNTVKSTGTDGKDGNAGDPLDDINGQPGGPGMPANAPAVDPNA